VNLPQIYVEKILVTVANNVKHEEDDDIDPKSILEKKMREIIPTRPLKQDLQDKLRLFKNQLEPSTVNIIEKALNEKSEQGEV
jgi:ribosomal protein L13